MMEALVKISDVRISDSASGPTVTAQQAWAAYVRRRWPRDCLGHVQAEWALSAGRARGVVYGQITQRTIDAVLAHPRGGAVVAVEVLALTFNLTARDFLVRAIDHERERLDRELTRIAAADAELVALERRLRGLGGR